MSLLSTVKSVCSVVGVETPTSVFSNIVGNRTMQEMLDLANEMAQRIAYDTREWTRLRTQATFTGDGIAEAFDLPDNYKRMLLRSSVWRSTSALQPMVFIPSSDDWMQRQLLSRTSAWGEWTMLGGQMHIWPIMDVNTTATFAYLDKNCIKLTSGGVGSEFMSDADSFLLDERLLKLAMVWQWKAQKGSPYAEDMGTYETALNIASGADGPAAIIVDRLPVSAGVRTAYPWMVPT